VRCIEGYLPRVDFEEVMMCKPRIRLKLFSMMMVSSMILLSGCQISVRKVDPDQDPSGTIQAKIKALETEKAALATNVATQGLTVATDIPLAVSTPTHDDVDNDRSQDPLKPLLITPEEIPSGLVFSTLDGIWWINHEGSVEKLSKKDPLMLNFLISSDGTRLAYQSENDLWLVYSTTGDLRRLTDTPKHKERLLAGLPGNPLQVLFTSQYEDGCRQLELMRIEGGWREPLINNLDVYSPLAVSPDGEELAFIAQECDAETHHPTAWIYTWGGWAEPFDLEAYSVSVEKFIVPSWSPDGRWLAWGVILSSEPIPEEEYVGAQEIPLNPAQLGVVLMDRITNEAKIVDVFEGDTHCQIGEIAWSPDGQWLAYSRSCMLWEANGLRVVGIDGQEIYNFPDNFVDPAWSPDSHWLVFADKGLMMVEVGQWVPFQIGPDYSEPVGWLVTGAP
jgi:hypothetical protein